MKKIYSLIALVAFATTSQAQYQLANSDFENWETVTYTSRKVGEDPVKWSSFYDATGGMKSTGTGNNAPQLYKKEDTRPGSAGQYSAQITSRSVLGGLAIAQGNLTNGCVNMGSMTATDASGNYNYINENREDQSMKFTGHPDALSVWLKMHAGANGKIGKVNVLLTTKGYYQDPVSEKNPNTAKLVATASNNNVVGNDTWTEYVIPFKYEANAEDPYYCLASIATAVVPGGGNANDNMYIDDMKMIYYSEAKEIKYNGVDVKESGTVDGAYDKSKLAVTTTGRAATWESSYEKSTKTLTITVKGENYSEDNTNAHTYTVVFSKDAEEGAPVPEGKALPTSGEKTYTDALNITLNGEPLPAQSTDVIISYNEGSIDFALKNFIIEDEEEPLYVGNIILKNIPVTHVANGIYNYSFNDIVTLEAGDLEWDAKHEWEIFPEDWAGPALGELELTMSGQISQDKLYVTLTIPVAGGVEVAFGEDLLTAVNKVVANKSQKGIIYNLNGQKVTETVKGQIYIIDGKKVVK